MDSAIAESAMKAGYAREFNFKENIESEIQSLETRLNNLKELKEIMDSEPKLARALEIIRSNGRLY